MIPIVDFSKCGLAVADTHLTASDRKAVGKAICDAFKTVGFVYLTNHGISDAMVRRTRESSDKFFRLPADVKQACARTGSDDNFGYVGMEVEQLASDRPGDLKEAFNMTPKQEKVNKWAEEQLPEFKKSMWEMYNTCKDLSFRILSAMGHGLDMKDPEIFVKSHGNMVSSSATTLRSLYYPPLPAEFVIKEKQIRCGEHSDYGSITLLFQDQVGGLEVMNKQGEYVAATPIEGAVLVNIGDLMQRWTSDTLVSTKHRVLIPEAEIKRREVRQSLAFFVHPDDHKLIECIDGTNKYEPITSLDYLNLRFAATY